MSLAASPAARPGRRLVVLYAFGAAGPGRLGMALDGVAPLAFAVRADEHGRHTAPLLARFGEVFLLPDDEERAAAEIIALDPAGVVTYSEQMLRLAGRVCDALGLPGADAAATEILTDKRRQRAVLRAAGIDTVRTATAADGLCAAVAAVGLPAVVKPAVGGGSRAATRVDSAADVTRLRDASTSPAEPVIVEELLVGTDERPFGDYVSVECRTVAGETAVLAVTSKFPLATPFREQGQMWPCHLPPQRRSAAAELARRAVGATGLRTGLTHTELKLTSAGPRLIEVNGRLGGNVAELADLRGGPDLVRVAALDALGHTGSVGPPAAGRVVFQFGTLAPRRLRRLLGVTGAKDVARLAGVAAYRREVRDGTHLDPGVATTWLDRIFGDVPDHAAAFDLVARSREVLRYRWLDVDGAEHTTPLPLAADA